MPAILPPGVGLRDGLQIEKQTVPPGRKLAWIQRLAWSSLRLIQPGSSGNPQKMPQMADTDELVRRLTGAARVPDVVFSGLVLNERGWGLTASAGPSRAGGDHEAA